MEINLQEQSGRFETLTLSLRLALLSAEVLLAPSPLTCAEACGHFLSFADSPAKCAEPPFLSWEISLAKTAVTNNQRSLPTRPGDILAIFFCDVRCAVRRLCEVQSLRLRLCRWGG